MELQTALLLSSSSSLSSCFSCSWCSVPHSPVVLRFSSLALFSRPPISGFRAAPSRISATVGDEERWLREEQRWLREEKRWLREEARWNAERRMMADELALLKRELEQLRAQVLERRTFSTGAATLPSVVASLKQLVQSLPVEPDRSLEFVEDDEDVVSPVSLSDRPSGLTFGSSEGSSAPSLSPSPSIPSMSEFSIDFMTDSPVEAAAPVRPTSASFRELRKGAEGVEVKLLQEALAELGFYSGEEDTEYSIFSSGTEAAVKTWQASIGVREDGIASPDLLVALFGKSKPSQNASSNGGKFVSHRGDQSDPWKAPSSATAATSTGRDVGTKKTFAEDKRDVESTEDGDIAPNRRVFLLGENRWEEPGRLGRPSSKANGASLSPSTPTSQLGGKAVGTEKCFSCKGEGLMMCTECEGTGDLNVEDQFLDWVEEGAKCPYCEGSGAVSCDVCLGRGAVPQV